MILTKATGEQITLQERLLELVHVDALLVHYIFRRSAREESGKPVVEIDKILGDTPALRLVRLQDRSISNTVDHSSQLPAEIVSILHADVHTLASLGTTIDQYGSCTHLKGSRAWLILPVSVYSIASEENAFGQREVISNTLSDLVCGPPIAVSVSHLVGL
jgi:hypothetical protein